MDLEVFFKVIAPTLATGAGFIGITTLDDENNFVSKMIDAAPSVSEGVFRTLKIELVCDDCKERGIADTCQHRLGMLPPWLDNEAFRKIEAMMSEHTEDFLREMKGFQQNGLIKRAFPAGPIRDMFDPENFLDTGREFVKHVFVTVDPAAGGPKSKYALVSAFYRSGTMVVSKPERNCPSSISPLRYSERVSWTASFDWPASMATATPATKRSGSPLRERSVCRSGMASSSALC